MKIKNLPKKIYLQIGEDCDCDNWNEIYPSHEVSWCADKINDNDIVYALDKRRIKEKEKNHSESEIADSEKLVKWFMEVSLLLRTEGFIKESILNINFLEWKYFFDQGYKPGEALSLFLNLQNEF